MPEEIDKGVDCRKTYKKPRRRIRIFPRPRLIKPEELLTLHAYDAPFDCDPGCYSWHLAAGRGTLSPEFGKSTNYRAPKIVTNVNCEWTAVISLLVGFYLLDTVIFSINTHDGKLLAYDIITLEQTIQERPPYTPWPPLTGPQPPPHITTNRIRMHTWANQYTCTGKLKNKYAWETRDFLWYYNRVKGEWLLFYGPTNRNFVSIPQMVTYYRQLNAHREGDIIDKRDRRAKKRGCCPLKLMEKELMPIEKPMPYF